MTDARSDDLEAQRLLTALREGTDAEQLAARLGLAEIFERRGLLDEAVACYLANLGQGDRDPRTCERLARVLRRQDGVVPPLIPEPETRPQPVALATEEDAAPLPESVAQLRLDQWAILLIVALICRVILDLGTSYSVVVAGFMMAAIALLTIAFLEGRHDEQAEHEDAGTGARAATQTYRSTLRAVAQALIVIPFSVEVLAYLIRRASSWFGLPL